MTAYSLCLYCTLSAVVCCLLPPTVSLLPRTYCRKTNNSDEPLQLLIQLFLLNKQQMGLALFSDPRYHLDPKNRHKDATHTQNSASRFYRCLPLKIYGIQTEGPAERADSPCSPELFRMLAEEGKLQHCRRFRVLITFLPIRHVEDSRSPPMTLATERPRSPLCILAAISVIYLAAALKLN